MVAFIFNFAFKNASITAVLDLESRLPVGSSAKIMDGLFDSALAMEARCYRGGSGRTKLYPLCYQKKDYIAYGIIVVYLIVMIVVGTLAC